jgi:ATP-dependent DNA ligase
LRRDATGVRLFTRNGHDWTGRFPTDRARAALSLKAASCLIDGEAVACDDTGLPVFDRLRYRRDDSHVFLYAFDLIELNGDDVRHEPIERRKVRLMRLIAKASVGLQINDHIVELGDVLFRHACQLGFEGIFSKRLGSPYRSGRSRHWIKSKNPAAPAVKREEEEDWTREKFACASPERFYSFGKIGHGHQETPERDRHSERNRSGPYHVHACLRSMKAQLSGR